MLTLLSSLLLPLPQGLSPLDQGTLIGHAALLESDRTSARMLDPQSERWAVAVVKSVGEYRLREAEIEGERQPWQTFDVDLDVIDGWNVPTGPVRAFWWEGSASRRFVIGRMVGQRALVRFAPVKDGRHLLVGTSVVPAFAAREGEPFVSILLPYGGTRLETGEPKFRGWKTLWRAGLALDAIAYPAFGRYMSVSMPLTPPGGRDERRDRNGNFLGDERPGLADAEWLFRLAKQGTPEFQMLVADYLRRGSIEGALRMKRDLVLLSLRQPDAFPNGFSTVTHHPDFFTGGATVWLPVPKVVDAIVATPHPMLASDLLELLIYKRYFVADRARLLPLLGAKDPVLRDQTLRAFDLWHGKAPQGTDALAWHRARAKLGMKELQAANAASGG